MNVTLRDYQQAAVDAIRASFARRYRAVLLVLPTGGGKTVAFCYIAEHAAAKGKRVLILVHRRELLLQASRTLESFGVAHGLIASGMSQVDRHAVQIASVQTLIRRMERMAWTPDLIIVDEAHHAIGSTTWGKVIAHYPRARILGVTATPQRTDGQGLGVSSGGLFEDMVIGPSVSELTDRGFLSPAVIFAPREQLDLSGIKMRGGDYAANELAAAVDKPTITGDSVAHYRKHGHLEPAIAFCASVAHAEHVASAFQSAGYQAASLDGSMDAHTRAQRIRDLGTGTLHVLTSCDIVSEGFDLPVVSAAILLRPTQSISLCLQQMGRVLRPHPGKTRALILDHVGNVFRHGLPDDERAWSLDATPKTARKTAQDLDSVRQCDHCYTVHRPAPACPACGYVYPNRPREIAQVAGELAAIDRAAFQRQESRERKREQSGARTFDDLVAVGRERGYRNPHAWASHVWQARQQRSVMA